MSEKEIKKTALECRWHVCRGSNVGQDKGVGGTWGSQPGYNCHLLQLWLQQQEQRVERGEIIKVDWISDMVNVRLQQQENLFLHPFKPPHRHHTVSLFLCDQSFLFFYILLLVLFLLVFIYLSEVVFRDAACHSSAWPIKHTVMTGWPRSKLITDWLTERVAPFCSTVFDSCLPDI